MEISTGEKGNLRETHNEGQFHSHGQTGHRCEQDRQTFISYVIPVCKDGHSTQPQKGKQCELGLKATP